MRRTDILLAVVVVVLAVGLILGPPLVEKWRAGSAPEQAESVEPVAGADDGAAETSQQDAAPGEAAEIERTSGMLMLYQACANRIDGFDANGREVFEAWKQRHAETLAKRGSELDFHIVLADPEGVERSDKSLEEERALCERNLDAMRADLGQSDPSGE